MNHTNLTLSARGTPIVLHSTSPIVENSKLLSAIVERWNTPEKIHYIDIDPNSFHFLIDMIKHRIENINFPSKLNKKITKLYYKKISIDPQIINAIINLEIDFDLEEWLVKEKWHCFHPSVSILNDNINEIWHYADCIGYIAYMLDEMDEYKMLKISTSRGVEDHPKTTRLHLLSLTIEWTTENGNWSNIISLGTQYYGSYSNQYNSILYHSYDNICNSLKNQEHPHMIDALKKYYNNIVELIPAYNNPKSRLI
tara:strand:+ start:913 stop:1674 length:762 start_codon:yes stop_codon:yes gene_type:complete